MSPLRSGTLEDYALNAANQRTSVTNADGSYWVYTYDALGQVTGGGKRWSGGTPVAGQQFEYAFDDIGNRQWTKAGQDLDSGQPHQAQYWNNALNQITFRQVPGFAGLSGTASEDATVSLNYRRAVRQGEYWWAEAVVTNANGPAWMPLEMVGAISNATGADIVTNLTGHALLPRVSQQFYYDADGNLTSDSLWTNSWNAENRRMTIESVAGVPTVAKRRVQWTHLGDGRWIERIVSTNNGSAYYPAFTNRYVWDGQVLLAVLDHTNGLVMSFMRGVDLSGSQQGAGGVGGLLWLTSRLSPPTSHFVSYDGNGNVTALVDASTGEESARYEYGPFGEAIRMTGPMAKPNPIRFSTQYADDVTGDVKYLFRDYGVSEGRWRSRDPKQQFHGCSMYCAMFNNTLAYFDGDGREASSAESGRATEPTIPNVSPCRWMGWEHRMSPEQTDPRAIGWTEYRDTLPRGIFNFESCNTDCFTGRAFEYECTVKIWIRSGTPLDYKSRTTTVWKHEVRHAIDSATNFGREIEAIKIARSWCLPADCHKIRHELVGTIYSAYESMRTYLSCAWDAADGLDDQAKYRDCANTAKKHVLEEAVKARKLMQDLSGCLKQSKMSEITKWPRLPSI